MTDLEIRAVLIEGLDAANIFTLRNNGWTPDFLAGTRDVAFADIDMDSLASMELCIAIEVSTGVSIVPQDLQELSTLGDLVQRVSGGLA